MSRAHTSDSPYNLREDRLIRRYLGRFATNFPEDRETSEAYERHSP